MLRGVHGQLSAMEAPCGVNLAMGCRPLGADRVDGDIGSQASVVFFISTTTRRSIEHRQMMPVFGTSCSLHGGSGRVRGFADRRYSEGRMRIAPAHAGRLHRWSGGISPLDGEPAPRQPHHRDGVLSEFRRGGWSDRVATKRTDRVVQAIAPLGVGDRSIAAAYVMTAGGSTHKS